MKWDCSDLVASWLGYFLVETFQDVKKMAMTGLLASPYFEIIFCSPKLLPLNNFLPLSDSGSARLLITAIYFHLLSFVHQNRINFILFSFHHLFTYHYYVLTVQDSTFQRHIPVSISKARGNQLTIQLSLIIIELEKTLCFKSKKRFIIPF